MLRTAVLQQVGAFDETAGHFELDYAQRYTQAGFRSAFLDGVHALHTGRLTSERNTSTRPNAYVRNGMPQFADAASRRAPLRASDLPVKVINLARRPDRLQEFNKRLAEVTDKSFAARVERFAAVDGHDLGLLPEIRHLFRGNDFRYRRGVIGCALSHLALWNEVATGGAPAMLVLEDDVTLCPDFERQLERVCKLLSHDAPGFDVTFLGFFDWHPRPEDDFAQRAGVPRLLPFEGPRFLRGSFAYIVSRGGAQRCWHWQSATASRMGSIALSIGRSRNSRSTRFRSTSRARRCSSRDLAWTATSRTTSWRLMRIPEARSALCAAMPPV